MYKYSDDEIVLDNYPEILTELYKFINSYGDFDYLPEVIIEFANNKNYSPELIADVISTDNSFKLALELNCLKQGTFREIKKTKDEDDVTDEIGEWTYE